MTEKCKRFFLRDLGGEQDFSSRITRWNFHSKLGHHLLQIAPHRRSCFRGVVAQDVGGMESGHQADAAPRLPLAAHFADGDLLLKHVLCSRTTERDDYARADD